MDGLHIGRQWGGHDIEDACACGQAACGLVDRIDDRCDQHSLWASKTIRQCHLPKDCPNPASRAA